MRFFVLTLFVLLYISSSGQTPEFRICNIPNPIPIDSLKKCHRLTCTDEKVLIQNFEVVFNSVQGMAMYSMGGKDLNAELMDHILKGKPRELHLKIVTLENKAEKVYKDVPILIKY